MHDRGRELLRGWALLAARWPLAVLALSVALLAVSSWYVVTHFAIHTDRDEMLAADLPFRVNDRRFRAAFPELKDELVLVLEARTPEQASLAAAELVAEIEARPDLFRGVLAPKVDEFLLRHAWLFLDEGQLRELLDRLVAVQPFLGRLARDPSLRGLLGLLVDVLHHGEHLGDDELARILARVSGALRAATAGDRHFVSWQEILSGGEPTADDLRTVVVARPVLDYGTLFPGAPAIDAVREIAREHGWVSADSPGGLRLRVTGEVALADEELASVQRGSELIGALIFVLVALVLAFGLRSTTAVLASLYTLVVGLAVTAALGLLIVGHLNLVSVAFAALFLGLAVDYAIHYCLRWRELASGGLPTLAALGEAAADTGGALFLCALTTALGFYAFIPTAYAGVSELGLIAGTGMFVGFACALTLLPAFLALGARGGRPPAPLRSGAGGRFAAFIVRHRRAVLVAFAVFFVVTLAALPDVRFDRNPLNLRDPDSESVTTFRDLLATSESPPWSLDVLAEGPEEAGAVSRRLRETPGVGRVVSVLDLVPEHQEEKLERIDEVGFFLALDPGEGVAPEPPSAGEVRQLLVRVEDAIREAPDGATGELADLQDAVRGFLAVEPERADEPTRLLAEGLLATLPVDLGRIRLALQADTFEQADLPSAWKDRWVSSRGDYRVQVFPDADLNDVGALRRFADAVRAVRPDATGPPVTIVESGDAVVRAFGQAMSWAVLATTLVLLFLLPHARDVAYVLLPLLLAAGGTLASLVALGLSFNYANVIGLPLLLGIGVDSAIHIVHRVRGPDPRHPLATSTARAIVTSALTTFCSFLGLALSPHRGTASMGWILTLGIVWTLGATLVFLPALMHAPRPDPEPGPPGTLSFPSGKRVPAVSQSAYRGES